VGLGAPRRQCTPRDHGQQKGGQAIAPPTAGDLQPPDWLKVAGQTGLERILRAIGRAKSRLQPGEVERLADELAQEEKEHDDG